MMSYTVTKDCKDWPATVKNTYEVLNKRFGSSARASDIFELWRIAFGLEELELLDNRMVQNGNYQAYLIDRLIDWNNGKEVDLHELYESVLEAGDFTASEKRIFESGEPENRMWAIILAITDPGNRNKIY